MEPMPCDIMCCCVFLTAIIIVPRVLHGADKSIKVECTCERPHFDPNKHPWPQFEKAWKVMQC